MSSGDQKSPLATPALRALIPPPGLQMLEREMAVREKEVEAIQAQATALAQEDQGAGEVERTSRAVEEKFRALSRPMAERCRRLQASREQHQFHRDVEDEIVSPWGLRWGGVTRASCSLPFAF